MGVGLIVVGLAASVQAINIVPVFNSDDNQTPPFDLFNNGIEGLFEYAETYFQDIFEDRRRSPRDDLVSRFNMTSAIADNPLFTFTLKAVKEEPIKVVFVNNEGERWEVSKKVKFSG